MKRTMVKFEINFLINVTIYRNCYSFFQTNFHLHMKFLCFFTSKSIRALNAIL